MASAPKSEIFSIAGREVAVTNPTKIFFPKLGLTKMDLVRYYLTLSPGVLKAVGDRPMALKRYPNGAEGDFFYQKRAPEKRPEWVESVTLAFPSGRTADEIVLRDGAQLAWVINLGCIDLHTHPVRADDLDHPDELRVDLDPVPGVPWSMVRDVAMVTQEALLAIGLIGWPKTSGSRGLHINVRIHRNWTFTEVRRAALALSRDVERRAPKIATSKWWKEERHGVFLDYNQNAKDRTTASAYSVRPTPDARVSAPLSWDELPAADPADFTLTTMGARFAKIGDVAAGIDDTKGSIEPLLELADRHEKEGLGDAPWPPHFQKMPGEPERVMPSKSRRLRGEKAPARGARKSSMPVVTIAKAAKVEEAMAGLERWKLRHPEAARHLQIDDVLVDSMRGRYTTWTRIRVNLRHVPEGERPAEEPPDPDFDPWAGMRWRRS